jgi:hypothetical protein
MIRFFKRVPYRFGARLVVDARMWQLDRPHERRRARVRPSAQICRDTDGWLMHSSRPAFVKPAACVRRV